MVVSEGPEPARPSGGKGVRNKIDEPEEDWLRQRGPRCWLFVADKGGDEASEHVKDAKDDGFVSDRTEVWLPPLLESKLGDIGSGLVGLAGDA